jgi:LCP family protein required for cell wall assembly
MIRRNRAHASPTGRARRLRESARREEEMRAQGMDPYAVEMASSGPGAKVALRRRGPSIKSVLLLSLLLVLILLTVGGILLWQRVAAFNDNVSTASAASSALWGPLGGEERINIALFGYGGSEHHSGNYLADSIQIVSIDPATDRTTIIPIPRDFWIEGLAQIPNNGKINESFAIGWQNGGVEEAAAVTTEILSEVTGLEVHHWMAIDFAGFQAMVDAVGGVQVNNPHFFRYTWHEWKYRHNVFDHSFTKGILTLNGKEALDYARARYTSVRQESSDFARSVRQQRVLAALRDKMGSGGLGSLGPGLSMMDALDSRMKTNLSAIDLFLLSSHLNPDRRIQLKEGRILEATSNTNGQYILVVVGRADATDYQPLRDYLARQLDTPIRSRSNASP